jgi:hypothetical protein
MPRKMSQIPISPAMDMAKDRIGLVVCKNKFVESQKSNPGS